MELDLPAVPALERRRGLGGCFSHAEIMADSGHYSIDSTTVRAHVSAAGRRAPDALLADKGYDTDAIRADLASRNIKAVIPGRSNRRVKIDHDRELYKQRNCIERMFGRLKINRSIATRYDQLANSFLGMVHIATARYWLKFVDAA